MLSKLIKMGYFMIHWFINSETDSLIGLALQIGESASRLAVYQLSLDTVIQWHSMKPSGYSDSFWPFPRVSLYVCNLAKKLYISYLRSILMNFASMLVILRLVKIVFFSKDENSSKKPEKAWKSPKPKKARSPKSPKLQGSGFGP